ncbi:MAG: hypothetical protein M1438_13760 [Deltaproteobacteria bacterium]|nr:hypothetical protein [Deltaproteobacteria bacterium]
MEAKDQVLPGWPRRLDKNPGPLKQARMEDKNPGARGDLQLRGRNPAPLSKEHLQIMERPPAQTRRLRLLTL